VRRQKLPKDDVGNHYTWKDLNMGVNVTAYGKVFHFYDCDKFTRVCSQNNFPYSLPLAFLAYLCIQFISE